MKIVIDMPEREYERLQRDAGWTNLEIYRELIKNGMPLPKGHGRLIDADALKHIIGQFSLVWEYGQGVSDCWDALLAAPTIIEADKEAQYENRN